jgi:excisionase family DNA binding protein
MRWVGLKEAAAHIGVSTRTVEKLVREQLIPFAQRGGPRSSLQFNLDEIDACLVRNTEPQVMRH